MSILSRNVTLNLVFLSSFSFLPLGDFEGLSTSCGFSELFFYKSLAMSLAFKIGFPCLSNLFGFSINSCTPGITKSENYAAVDCALMFRPSTPESPKLSDLLLVMASLESLFDLPGESTSVLLSIPSWLFSCGGTAWSCYMVSSTVPMSPFSLCGTPAPLSSSACSSS